jgi:hypothetical protein
MSLIGKTNIRVYSYRSIGVLECWSIGNEKLTFS